MEQVEQLPAVHSSNPQSPSEQVPDISTLSLEHTPIQGNSSVRISHLSQPNISTSQLAALRSNQNGHSQNGSLSAMTFGKPSKSRPRSIPSAAHIDRGVNGHGHGHGHFRPGVGPFDGHRSPPSKNLSHVPCRFFKQGNCQAGKACPFSHEIDADLANQPCKYFQKGTCKYGQNCANAHYLPDGRRVPTRGPGGDGGRGRSNFHPFMQQDLSMPTTSLLTQQANETITQIGAQSGFPMPSDEAFSQMQGYGAAYAESIGFETELGSPKIGSMYGSPTEGDMFPKSPLPLTLAHDAPFPSSFDSQGVSRIWRDGPIAASVPTKFGLLGTSISQTPKFPLQSDALRNLHDSAFANEARNRLSLLGSSPLTESGLEDSLTQRMLQTKRLSKLDQISGSFPRSNLSRLVFKDDDVDRDRTAEEDLLPSDLHDEVLTPQERLRRFSRNDNDLGGVRESLGVYGSPVGSFTKFGSPISSSPSRFAPIFAKQQEKKRQEEAANNSASFAHIGSPLRNTSFSLGLNITSPSQTTTRSTPDDISLHFSKSPRQSAQSMLSQQLHQARLGRGKAESSENVNGNRPAISRSASGTNNRSDNAASISNVAVNKLDEDQNDMVFSMDQPEEDAGKKIPSVWNSQNAKSPDFGPIGGSRGVTKE